MSTTRKWIATIRKIGGVDPLEKIEVYTTLAPHGISDAAQHAETVLRLTKDRATNYEIIKVELSS